MWTETNTLAELYLLVFLCGVGGGLGKAWERRWHLNPPRGRRSSADRQQEQHRTNPEGEVCVQPGGLVLRAWSGDKQSGRACLSELWPQLDGSGLWLRSLDFTWEVEGAIGSTVGGGGITAVASAAPGTVSREGGGWLVCRRRLQQLGAGTGC